MNITLSTTIFEFSFLCIVLLLGGCESSSSTIREDDELIREIEYSADGNMAETVVVFKYDEVTGRLCLKSFYDAKNAKEFQHIAYLYNSTILGEKADYDTLVYVNDGYVEKYVEISDGSAITYDGVGCILSVSKVTKSESSEPQMTNTYYDESGNTLYFETSSYDKNGKELSITRYQNNILEYYDVFLYDGNRLTRRNHYNSNGKLIGYSVYEYK